MERNPEVPASTRDEALFIPAGMPKESRGGPRNTKGDLTSLRRHEWSPRSTRNLRRTQSFPPQLHANYEILPCTLEEALLRCSVSKESPRFPWNSKGSSTHFTKLQKFPEIPVLTREVRCFPLQVKKGPVFLLKVEIGVDCRASPGKEHRRSRRNSRGGWYLLDTGRDPVGLVTIREPRISPSTKDQAVFPCTDSNFSRALTHNTKGVLMPQLLIRKEP